MWSNSGQIWPTPTKFKTNSPKGWPHNCSTISNVSANDVSSSGPPAAVADGSAVAARRCSVAPTSCCAASNGGGSAASAVFLSRHLALAPRGHFLQWLARLGRPTLVDFRGRAAQGLQGVSKGIQCRARASKGAQELPRAPKVFQGLPNISNGVGGVRKGSKGFQGLFRGLPMVCVPQGSCSTSRACLPSRLSPTGRMPEPSCDSSCGLHQRFWQSRRMGGPSSFVAPILALPPAMVRLQGRGIHLKTHVFPLLQHWSHGFVQHSVPEGWAFRRALLATCPHRHFLSGHFILTGCQKVAHDAFIMARAASAPIL